jgi:hypothetical protein
MVYHGHGFTWTELYNMPVWLRKFYYKKMEEAMSNAKTKAETKKPGQKPRISKPAVGPR